MEVIYQIASRDDVREIIELCNECFFEKTDYEKALKIFEETENDSNNIYVIGRVDGVAVAHAKVSIIRTMYEPMGCFAILNHVCVKPDYRRHNIATGLLDEITRLCQERNVKKLELWSNNVRVPAHACYKKYGFVLEEAGFFSKEI